VAENQKAALSAALITIRIIDFGLAKIPILVFALFSCVKVNIDGRTFIGTRPGTLGVNGDPQDQCGSGYNSGYQ